MGESAGHTDAVFEESPTRFFVIHPDKRGGGVFRILKVEDLTHLLSPEAVDVLSSHEFDVKVPAEFFKSKKPVKVKLLDVDAARLCTLREGHPARPTLSKRQRQRGGQ